MKLRTLGGYRWRTLVVDTACNTTGFVAASCMLGVTLHVAQNTGGRHSTIEGLTARQAGYGLSLTIRAWIETHFEWLKAAVGEVARAGLLTAEGAAA